MNSISLLLLTRCGPSGEWHGARFLCCKYIDDVDSNMAVEKYGSSASVILKEFIDESSNVF